jgi:hypothetical protein
MGTPTDTTEYDNLVLHRARFMANMERIMGLAGDSCGGEAPPVPETGGFFLDAAGPAELTGHATGPGGLLATAPEEDEDRRGPVELMGDWSWRPEMQVKDPGYIFSKDELAAVNEALELSDAFGASRTKGMRLAMALIPPRPWMVPAYDGRDLRARPPRIGSIR